MPPNVGTLCFYFYPKCFLMFLVIFLKKKSQNDLASYNVQLFGDFSRYFFHFKLYLNSLVVRKDILYNSNFYKFIEIDFTGQKVVYRDECSMHT